MEKILEELYQESLKLKKEIQLIDLLNEKLNSRDLIIKQLIFRPDANIKIKMYKEHHGENHMFI